MSEQTVRLVRDGQGGYATPDGRWVVAPVDGMGSGVNNNGGWSNGKRAWRITDTTGQAILSKYGDPHSAIRDRLWEARDLIAAKTSKED